MYICNETREIQTQTQNKRPTLQPYRLHFYLSGLAYEAFRWALCLAVLGGGFAAMLAAFDALGWLGPHPWN